MPDADRFRCLPIAPRSAAGRDVRVLILRDPSSGSEPAEEALREEGMQITSRCVASREEFSDQLETFAPDIVLADSLIPKASSLEALQALKNRHPDIPLVIVTPSLDDQSALPLIMAGSADVVLQNDRKGLAITVAAALERKKTEKERSQALEALRFTQFSLDNAAEMAFWIDREGLIKHVNLTSCLVLGFSHERLRAMHVQDIDLSMTAEIWPDLWATFKRRGRLLFESSYRTCNGRLLPVEVSAAYYQYNGTECVFALSRNISERKRSQEHEKLTWKILELLNRADEEPNAIDNIVHLIKEHTDLRAVAIRLKKDEDFPIHTAVGHPDASTGGIPGSSLFDCAARLARDAQGHSVADCLCAKVIFGGVDPSIPFATEGGSVLTNSTTEFREAIKALGGFEANRICCAATGYESLALVPLRSGSESIGLLLLADRRKGVFSVETIRFFEGIGESIGIMLRRQRAQKDLIHDQLVSEAIASVSLGFLESGSMQRMAQILVERAVLISDALFGVVIDYDAQAQVRILSASAMTGKSLRGRSLSFIARQQTLGKACFAHPIDGSLLDDPIRDGRTVLMNYAAEHPSWFGAGAQGQPEITSYLGVPITSGGKVAGTIALANRLGGFTERQRQECEALANAAALALRVVRSEAKRVSIEKQLRQSQKMEAVAILAGGVAHDFNNLLTVITGNTQLALNEERLPDCLKRNLAEISRAADRAADLTRQLLTFSRRQSFEPKVLDCNDVIAEMDMMLRRLIGENISLVTSLDENLWPVEADAGQIEQLIANLAVNARDAMPGGGTLNFRTSNLNLDEEFARSHPGAIPGDYVMLTVGDTGCGMTDEVKSHLYEPFFTTKEVGKGTGLGLATCYGIVEQNRGFMAVTSTPGHGSVFSICLPRTGKAPRALPASRRIVDLPRGKETILLVEDEPSVREVISLVLRSQGYTVLEAVDGEDGLRAGRAAGPGKIDLLLSDMLMPRMGGRELAAHLKAIDPRITVLYISGHPERPTADGGPPEDGIPLLQKPFTREGLTCAVREILDARPAGSGRVPAGAQRTACPSSTGPSVNPAPHAALPFGPVRSRGTRRGTLRSEPGLADR